MGVSTWPRKTLTLSSCCRLQRFSRFLALSLILIIGLILLILTILSKSPSENFNVNNLEIDQDLKQLYPTLFNDGSIMTSSNKNNANNYKCRRPELDPWDPSIQQYLTKSPTSLQCKKLQPEVTYVDETGRIVINTSALEESGYKTDDIICHFRYFDRTEGLDDVTLNETDWLVLESGQKIETTEFVEVSCSRRWASALNFYTNLHSHILRRKMRKNKKLIKKVPNVLLFVLDSVSRSSFLRSLPKLLAVLNDSDYQSVQMEGFTKIGDNSFPNAAAFLTGKRVCVAGYHDELPCDMSKEFFDNWPLIWRNFSQKNYVTHYAEDYPNFNLFKYLSNGFKRRPVDHYFRPFWVKLWSSFLHRRSTHLCFGNVPKHKLQLEYLERLFKVYSETKTATKNVENDTEPNKMESDEMGKSEPIFAFSWHTELGHDWMGQISVADQDLAEFFIRLKPQLIPNTILIVFSDHGHRFDAIRQTQVGRLEERLPFMSISIPKWLRHEKPDWLQSLKMNSKRLTTPFDIHATLFDLLNLSGNQKIDNNLVNNRYETQFKWGKSLFNVLPENRRCPEAGIPNEFCTCEKELNIDKPNSDPNVQLAAQAVVNHVNNLLTTAQHANQCAQLTLQSIHNAQVSLPARAPISGGFFSRTLNFLEMLHILPQSDSFQTPKLYYRATIEVKPSQALFEAMVGLFYEIGSKSRDQVQVFKVIGDVNRINKYGDQSKCAKSALLKKYCFCV